jgi:hypothetical protein
MDTPRFAPFFFDRPGIKLGSVSLLLIFLVGLPEVAQARQSGPSRFEDATVARMIATYQADPRGPYRDLRWFCKDGSTVAPQQRCPEPGVQRARYRQEVEQLAADRHIFLGQILSATPVLDVWDSSNNHSRLKQYQLEQFLRQVDDGWVNRQAQFYRGAYQEEDENKWGLEFLRWLAAQDRIISSQFFLLRQAVKDIPHYAEDNLSQRIRTVSREIAEAYPAFVDLRVKIHGQPERADLQAVRSFRDDHADRLNEELESMFDQLEEDLALRFEGPALDTARKIARRLPAASAIRIRFEQRALELEDAAAPVDTGFLLANLSRYIRLNLAAETTPAHRLTALDLLNALEEVMMAHLGDWTPRTLEEELNRLDVLSTAAVAFGYLEVWEYYEAVRQLSTLTDKRVVPLTDLDRHVKAARRMMEWSSTTVLKTYEHEEETFARFEPLASGFTGEKIRSSILLYLGASVGKLGAFITERAGSGSEMMGITNAAQARGLNPGYATGELVVVQSDPESVEIDPSKIYVFNRPPSDLKPVAGILTVTEGNMVSHVQLLARNLGIPNGVLSAANFQALQAFHGRRVFLAVSPEGAILMKPESGMNATEKALFEVRNRAETRISVPVERIRLDVNRVLNLSDLDAQDSGILTGPKAANLGQLKAMFPEYVVDGIVIPFGVFRRHMNQDMPGTGGSYWAFLTGTFREAARLRTAGESESDIETYVLSRLDVLREAISEMPLLPAFVTDLETTFQSVLGEQMGTLPVFVRSDTNMEDLKDFTGAGLNLTLFNVLDRTQLLNGIKRVWASPYSERSFRWRQRYLLNPENVFPSILIIPSVDADMSGVMITKGLSAGTADDVTVAFSLGVGGAVDGQIAETWLMGADGRYTLLSPAREFTFRTVPPTGGTGSGRASFEERILAPKHLDALADMAAEVKSRLPGSPGVETQGPFDVELGFKDNKIWLLQVRPFVEDKMAQSSDYLRSLSRPLPSSVTVPLTSPMRSSTGVR